MFALNAVAIVRLVGIIFMLPVKSVSKKVTWGRVIVRAVAQVVKSADRIVIVISVKMVTV